ncbi:MAG TPA: hypothetical protein VJ385_11690 [Fibrobacteria bacterium]|nr:hypothetical protein [Fibrobacteria bacterium]
MPSDRALPSPPGKIAFFLTGHGFGHAVRNCALMEALPAGVDIDIYTSIPESFFRDELHRPFRVIPCEIDCGCLQADTVEVDVEGTLARYLELDRERPDAIARYAPMLRAGGADLVVADTPPLALPIAEAAGVPAWCVCNFTWLDIYAPYVAKHPRYLEMFRRMQADYALADRHVRIHPAMAGAGAFAIEPAGIVCRPARRRRDAFAERFGLDPARKWALIYIGSFGLEGVDWARLADYPDWEFMGLYPLAGAPANYRFLKKDLSFRYADLNASCDLVLGKLGYGLVAECLAQAKPVIFLGRRDFDEFPVLKGVLEERGLGVEIPLDRFLSLDIGAELRALAEAPHRPVKATGVSDILRKMGYAGDNPL